MNCYKHNNFAAVGTCQQCGVGLCPECVNNFEPKVCDPCATKMNTKFRMNLGTELLTYSIAFLVVGFALASISSEDRILLFFGGGYTAAEFVSGFIFIQQRQW